MTVNLVVDVGGTNTRVAQTNGPMVNRGSIQRYRNDDFAQLTDVIQRYCADHGPAGFDAVCACLAGPVEGNMGRLTNRDWSIDTETLAQTAGATRGALLNDLQAQGHAVGQLGADALTPILTGFGQSDSNTRLVINVGTGFNAAVVYETRHGTFVPPSECGHATLPLRSNDDMTLAQFIAQHHGFPSVEEALSGRGLETIHAFVNQQNSAAGHMTTSQQIMADFLSGQAPHAQTTAQWFSRFIGAVAGDLALVHLPFGGIYLVGGMARAFGPYLCDLGFATAFHDKGRFGDYTKQFTVHMVKDDYAALTGCATYL
ncbi:MAG: glucokinase, partial [Pseudomonadota bacterium]